MRAGVVRGGETARGREPGKSYRVRLCSRHRRPAWAEGEVSDTDDPSLRPRGVRRGPPPPRPFDRRRYPAASLEWLLAHRVLGKGGGDRPAPPFLGARLVGEFELGDSVHALDNLMDRVDRTEDSVHPLT